MGRLYGPLRNVGPVWAARLGHSTGSLCSVSPRPVLLIDLSSPPSCRIDAINGAGPPGSKRFDGCVQLRPVSISGCVEYVRGLPRIDSRSRSVSILTVFLVKRLIVCC